MDSLYLLQFACCIFMVVNAAFVGLGSLYTRRKNRRYEQSRRMIFLALMGLAVQYLLQMCMGFRAMGDDLGAVVNMLLYTPCIMLISKGIYNIEAPRSQCRRMNGICLLLYLAVVAVFAVACCVTDGCRIGRWLYVMLFFYGVSMVYCVAMVLREMLRYRRMLETMTASDMLPYMRYQRASIVIVSSAALVLPVAILSSTLLYILGPVVLLALLFFVLTFVSLGDSYVPADVLLGDEEQAPAGADEAPSMSAEAIGRQPASQCTDDADASSAGLTEERCTQIGRCLETWCAGQGYKDSTVNMMNLSRSIGIARSELTQYFDQCLHSTFRVWLSDIRFQAAKDMMRDYPYYSNDVISVECGFSARTQLYRIFKAKEGCTPTEWRAHLSKQV